MIAKRRKNNSISLRTKLFRGAGLVIIVPLLAWFPAWLLSGDEIELVRWGAYGGAWLGLAGLVAALLFVAGKAWWRAGLAALLGIAILLPVLPRFNPVRWLSSPGASNLRVISFNVSTMNPDMTGVARLIAREHPDIVFLQQASDFGALRRKLTALGVAPYYALPDRESVDTAYLSRFALTKEPDNGRPEIPHATATIAGCRIALWNLHAPHGQNEVAAQAQFFVDVTDMMRPQGLPIVAGGDLNSTEYNSAQIPLRDLLHDAYAEAGTGPGFTFPSKVRRFGMLGRLFRIDHVMYNGDLVPVAGRVLQDDAGSDHLAVLIDFQLKPCNTNAVSTGAP